MSKITKVNFQNKKYTRPNPIFLNNYFTTYYIIGFMFLFFVAQIFFKEFLSYVVLNSNVFNTLYLWQFITYPFVTVGTFSLLMSALVLFFMGMSFEMEVGSAKFLSMFFINTISTGLLSVLGHYLASVLGFPHLFTGALYDNSVVLNVIIFSYACRYPDSKLNFYFLIPISIKIGVIITLVFNFVYFVMLFPSLNSISMIMNILVPYLYLKFVMKLDLLKVFFDR